MPTALILLPDGFEEIEAITPIDLLRRAQVEIVTAATGDTFNVTGRSGICIQADTTLAAVGSPLPLYDMLILPGGPGVKLLRQDLRVRHAVLAHHAAGRWLAAICAAPAVLYDAGLLNKRRYTAHFSVAHELPAILSHERTVTDGTLLTSRGAGTALEFGLLLVEKLTSPEKAAEVRQSICA
jgi:4-methyl-5(b-hydroxyethyl)-thiazole monophosphate biosynthesis